MTAKPVLLYEGVVKLWEQRLNSIPTVFGRMVYMAQQRRMHGRYTDPELVTTVSQTVCARVIREAHMKVFRIWLSLSMEEQAADLKPYFQTITFSGAPHDLRIKWNQLCRDLIPPRVSSTEVNLFLGTAQTLLRFLVKRRSRSKL
jgi:hypothetical protein